MKQAISDDREHRRGLVLGFTLAEVLLLILFLLLLALGSKLQKLDDERAQLVSKLAAARDRENALTSQIQTAKAVLREKGLPPLETGALPATTTELDVLTDDERARVGEVYKQAKTINPNDPIELLRRGMEVVVREQPMANPLEMAQAPSPAGHNWPPIIRLSEADGFYFQSGSAELSQDFRTTLGGAVMEKLLSIIKDYQVDVIEVIGHTDAQPLVVRASNLDKTLIPFLQGQPHDSFLPSDNAGLGLARAAAVVRVLSGDERLKGLKVLPLSGAQLIDVGDQLTASTSFVATQERRRIEIRVRRSDAVPTKQSESQGPEPFAPVVGPAVVIDADTIKIGDVKIRVWGVDAIEATQRCRRQGHDWDCASESTAALRAHVAGQLVTCKPHRLDRGRRVSTCRVSGADLGDWLVSNGHAVDFPQFSGGHYASSEVNAKTAKLGIWSGEFEAPWDWRKSKKNEAVTRAP